MGKVFNSFLGKRSIINKLLNWRKSEFLLSAERKFVVDRFGHYIVRIFGLPMVEEGRLRYRAILKFLKQSGVEGKILDMGCGYGQLAFELARRMQTSQVVGIDVNMEDIRLANAIKKHLNIDNCSFIRGYFERNTFSNEEFDCIIMGEVLEHVQDDAKVVGEANRILRKGGIIIVVVPYDQAPCKYSEPQPIYKNMPKYAPDAELFLGDYHFTSGYNKGNISNLFENQGFEILHSLYIYEGMAALLQYLPCTSTLFPLRYPLSLLPIFKSRCEVALVGKKPMRGKSGMSANIVRHENKGG